MTLATEANQRMNRALDTTDPQIADLLRQEAQRQATGQRLLSSTNVNKVSSNVEMIPRRAAR